MGDEAVSLIRNKLNSVPDLTSQPCIYKVPTRLREARSFYSPTLISIGPLHHETEKLRPMEVHKLQYLKYFLNKKPENTLEYYVEGLRGLEKKARECYEEPINLTSAEFLAMMLIDGSFIIILMLNSTVPGETRNSNDPVFSTCWMFDQLNEDMLLLENQLPFFALQQLYDLLNCRVGEFPTWNFSFFSLTCDFFIWILGKGRVDFVRNSSYQVKHFIDLLRLCYAPSTLRITPKLQGRVQFIPSATQLHASGVKFAKRESSFLDISFTKKGVMKIPPVVIDDGTEILFRNIIAFEQSSQDTFYILDYSIVMHCLINTPNDVALLRNYGVLNNWLGNDDDIPLLFNNIGKNTISDSDKFHYAALFEDLNAYYNKRENVWRAKLTRDYFDTPWSTISFAAAVILLVCTLIQTLYAMINK